MAKGAGWLALLGLIAGEIAGAMMHFRPFWPQQILRTAAGSVSAIALAGITATALVIWAQSRGRDWPAFVWSLGLSGALAVVVNVWVPHMGWWKGPVFDAPTFPLACLTGLRAMFIVGLLLLLYRWLAQRRRWLSVMVYGLLLLSLIPGTIHGDHMLIASRVLWFEGGYTIWHDVALGEVFFALPVLIYEFMFRDGRTT